MKLEPVCVHELPTLERKGQYIEANQLPEFATMPHKDSLSKQIWSEDTIYWKLETDAPSIEGRKLEEMVIKNAALAIGLLIPQNIRSRNRPSADADIIINCIPSNQDSFFQSRPSVLAYAFGPASGIGGDITFNSSYLWWLNGDGVDAETYTFITGRPVENPTNTFTTWDMQHTMTHEMLHAFGVPHNESCPNCIMYPYYNRQRVPQKEDIAYLQGLYGKAPIHNLILEKLLARIGRGVKA